MHGRDDELAMMRAALAGASAPDGRLVLVAGEAGIGKTALVETVAAEASATGATVLTGHCYDLDATAPYAPWVSLLRSYSANDDLPPLPPGLSDAELLETLAGKDALFEQLTGFLGDLTSVRPAVLVLEDLHWSDQASLDLLRAVTRRVHPWSLLVVATFRDDELTPRQPLHRVLPALVREGRPLRIELRPLGKDAIQSLVAERYELPPHDQTRLVDHLERYAEGNPFHLDEVLRTLEYERLLRRAAHGWAVADLSLAPVPPLVRQMIDERVARLGEDVRRLLQAAAVIGLIVPVDLWQAAAEVGDDEFADAVEHARSVHLLTETPDHTAFRFEHALVREALYEGAALPRRRSWHRLIGELLASQPNADPEGPAHHFLQAGDSRAVDWLIRAGQRAERRDASWDAVARYERALPLLEQSGPGDRLAWLHADLAESYRYIDPTRSAAHLDAAERAALDTQDPVLSLAIRWLRTRLRGFFGQGVIDDLRECVVALQSLSSADHGRLAGMGRINLPSRGLLAQWIAFHGKYDEAIAHADAVLADGRQAGSPKERNELGGASIALGLAHSALGRPAAATEAFTAAREHFRAIDSGFMVASTQKWEWIEVAMAYFADDLDLRQRLINDYTETMAQLGSFAVFRNDRPLLQIFGPAMLQGRWQEVRESATAYLNVPAWRVSALAALGDLERRQGRTTAAWGRVRSGIPGGPDTEPSNLYFVDTLALQRLGAELALDEGALDVALAWINAHDRWLEWSGRVLDRSSSLLLRARYALVRGERRTADELARRALELASEPRQPLALLAAHRFLGAHATEAGSFDEAGEHLDAALALADACAAPYERALTLVEQAAWLIGQGRLAEISPVLGEAGKMLGQLEAKSALDRLATLTDQARGGGKPRLPAGLSSRELEVLRLLVAGHSNREIGDLLYISPATATRHVANIYAKLGVDSRAEASAFAHRHGLA